MGFLYFFFFLRKKAFGWCFSWAAVQLGTAFKLYTCLFNNWLSFACKIYGYCACLCSWNEWEIINIKLKCAVEWWHAKKHRSQKKMIKKHQRKMPPKFRQRHYKAWFVLSSERIQSQPCPLSLQKKKIACALSCYLSAQNRKEKTLTAKWDMPVTVQAVSPLVKEPRLSPSHGINTQLAKTNH